MRKNTSSISALTTVVLLLLSGCSSYKVIEPKVYNQSPGTPTSSTVTVISFGLELNKEAKIGSTLKVVGSEETFSIKEVLNASNELMDVTKPLAAGMYRIVAKTEKQNTLRGDVQFEITVNEHTCVYTSIRSADVPRR